MLRLRCFGRLAIEDDGGERYELRSRKHLALLLYLAAHRDRRHERERVARLFWDTEVSLARHSLSQALYDLRKRVPGLELDRTNREVGLGPEGLLYEGRAFEQAVAGDELGRAARLYGGPFAPDIETVGGPDFERWVERERTRYRSLAEKTLLRRVSECADAGRWGEMCVAGNRLVDLNPLSEGAHRAVMRGLWLQGDRAAALAHFEEHEDFLRRESPGGIGEETKALVEKIRRSERTDGGEAVRERTRPEMVGREEEFRALRDALEDVLAGESRFVLVRGEAGIGKTRLLEEFAEVVALEDVRLLESRCYAAESDVPYGPIVDGLRELASEGVGEGGDGDSRYFQLGHLFPETFGEPERDEWDEMGKQTARRRLAEEVREFLAGWTKDAPIAWFIEDLHWADSTSLWVLSYLARRLEDVPFFLVATSRRKASELAPENAASDPWRRVQLGRLSSEEIQQLISAAGRATSRGLSRVAHLADGNPFYALELAKSNLTEVIEGELHHSQRFREELPTAIARVLRSEIADVSDQEARILEVVAVAEGHAYPNLVIDATDLSTPELVRAAGHLRERGLLRSTEDRLTFHHDIVRRFVYHSLDTLSRTALHRGIADWLAENRNDVDPGTLALHYHEADDSERAYALSIDAARSAIQRHANQEAINLSRLALDCAANDEERREASCLLGEALYRDGKYQEALGALSQLGDGRYFRSVVGRRSIQLLRAAAAIQTTQWETAAVAINNLAADQETNKADYLWGKHLMMKAAIRSDNPPLADATLADVCEAKVSNEDLVCRTMLWMTKTAYRAFYGNISDCRGYIEFIQRYANDLPKHLQFKARNLSMLVSVRLGEFDAALQQGRTTLRLATKQHNPSDAMNASANTCAVYLRIGEWDKAKAELERIEDQWMKGRCDITLSNAHSVAALNRADYLLFSERFDEAQSYNRRLQDQLPPSGAEYLHAEISANRGLTAAARRQPMEALKMWGELRKTYSQTDFAYAGLQNRYKLYWLAGIVGWYEGDSSIVPFLRQRADDEERVDKIGAAMTQYIVRLFDAAFESGGNEIFQRSNSLAESSEFSRLQEKNVTWFGYFARRWFRRACIDAAYSKVTSEMS